MVSGPTLPNAIPGQPGYIPPSPPPPPAPSTAPTTDGSTQPPPPSTTQVAFGSNGTDTLQISREALSASRGQGPSGAPSLPASAVRSNALESPDAPPEAPNAPRFRSSPSSAPSAEGLNPVPPRAPRSYSSAPTADMGPGQFLNLVG